MNSRPVNRPMATMPTVAHELSEENLAEIDEPPDTVRSPFCWSPPNLCTGFMRNPAKGGPRRESLLTRQLHSETEPTDNDEPKSPARALSTQSTWSSISMPSTAELTSDDGRSMPSVAGSPPPPPTRIPNAFPAIQQKPVDQAVKIVGHDISAAEANKATAEANVEANLGRKRCISFACRGKQDAAPAQVDTGLKVPPPSTAATAASPPKRKCMLKFVCPMKAEADAKAAANKSTAKKRPTSPPPMSRHSASKPSVKHRGSDSTISQISPKATRKSSATDTKAPEKGTAPAVKAARRYSDASDNDTSGDERHRFHEFATSDDEPEAWTQMSTCHQRRLTVDDTLKKENVIRKTCTEVEEEVMEEEEEEEEEDLDDELAAVADMEQGDTADDGDETDEGFHSDDEGGFASSDADSDSDSDFEWWKPSGLSTAATSMDQLDRLAIVNSQVAGSAGSASSSPTSPRTSKLMMRKAPPRQISTPAVSIKQPATTEPDLPDTSDFVCGTLDEDRTLEEDFINRRNQKLAAKRPVRPQDIDPTFPTSDPEMDEEDDDDVVDPPHSNPDESDMMHGQLDEIHGPSTVRKRSPAPLRRARTSSNAARSPPPPARHPSPAPVKRRSIARSPPPPRKLFGHSPSRTKSPTAIRRMTSPPNSPTERTLRQAGAARGLGGRPQPTHTSSLPRGGAPIAFNKLATIPSDDESSTDQPSTDIPKRGAIDIVKGLEKKRAWRKKKLAQKMCAKAANKCEKPYKVKPGLGAERMREVGLQLQGHHGKAEHILSL